MSGKTYTLAEVLEAFLGQYHNASTRKGYRRDLSKAVEWLGPQKRVGELARLDVARYVGTITAPDANAGRPYKPNTARGKLKTLNTFLTWCHKQGLTAETLSDMVRLPSEPESDARLRAYTPEQVDALIAYAEGLTPHSGRRLRDLALFLFAHDTGARVGSLVKVTRGDVDLRGQVVTLYNTKRRRWYSATFGGYTAGVLREWFHVLPDVPGAYLFNSRQPGQPMSAASISQIPGRACDLLGIPRQGVHGFRRAVGVRMVDAGFSGEFVADVLNDSVEVVNKHYSPREIPAAKEAARRLAYMPPGRRKVRRFKSG